MKSPVYRFSEVLRSLRNEADMTVLEASGRMGYGNYERWESGKTKVGAHHLVTLAAAFGVTAEVWLLVYAWLVDRLVPLPGKAAVQVDDQLRKLATRLPERAVELPYHAGILNRPRTHTELAVACFVARYGQGPADQDAPIILQPAARSKPAHRTPGQSVLQSLYGDVFDDWNKTTVLSGVLAALGQQGPHAQLAAATEAAQVLFSPGGVEQIEALMALSTSTGQEQGYDRLPAMASAVLPMFKLFLPQLQADMKRLQDAVAREPMTQAEFFTTFLGLVQRGPEAFLAEDCPIDITNIPDLDPSPVAAGVEMFDRADREFREMVGEELRAAAETASPADGVAAVSRARRTTR